MKTVTMAAWYFSVACGNLLVIIITQAQFFSNQVWHISEFSLPKFLSFLPPLSFPATVASLLFFLLGGRILSLRRSHFPWHARVCLDVCGLPDRLHRIRWFFLDVCRTRRKLSAPWTSFSRSGFALSYVGFGTSERKAAWRWSRIRVLCDAP